MGAAASPMQGLQEEAACPICLEYCKDPVMTKCGHNFCRVCITGCSEEVGTALPCPQCREMFPQGDLRPNGQLQTMVENMKQLSVRGERPPREGLCEEHEERLKLFCDEDQRLICVICRESSQHKAHNVRPMEEAAQEYTRSLQDWQETLRVEMAGVSQTNLREEEACRSLKDIRSTLGRCEHVAVLTPEGIRKKYKVHVTLDADTAQRRLMVSEAGRRVANNWAAHRMLENPTRFTCWHSVQGTEGFFSGRHYWELEILQHGGWHLGVAQETVRRKRRFTHCPEEGVWVVMWDKKKYKALTSPPSHLSPLHPLWKLGVFLDYEGGRVSVYNARTMEEHYTFTGASFTGRVYPYFQLYYPTELRLV